MLAYAFQVLNKKHYVKLETEEFEYTSELFAAILTKGISNQIKQGLGKDYVENTQSLRSPRGKINVTLSVKQQTMIDQQLVCSFDEYTENSYMNQILKTTALLLMKTPEVSTTYKKDLKKLLVYFSNVDVIDYRRIQWSRITYHRNNATYKMLINICYLIIEGMLLTEKEGSHELAEFMDNQKMHRLFEKFVLAYYRKHFPQFRASASHIDWNVDEGLVQFLPVMKTDITLQYKGKTLIIDTKYYEHTMQRNSYYESRSFHSHNMYQIFTYVKNKDNLNSGNVSGVLLYAKTDEDIVPDNEFLISGNQIAIKTLDLNTEFHNIKEQLNHLAERFLLN